MFNSQKINSEEIQFKKNKIELTCKAYDCKNYQLGETCGRESIILESKGIIVSYVICKNYEEI